MRRWLRALVVACTTKGWARRLLIGAVAALVIGLIRVGYALNVPGLVASGDPKTAQYQPGKTVWDWLQLLIVPAVLAGATIWFTSRQSKREQQANQEQSKIERELAQDQQRENALQSYLDHMAELLLKENLHSSKEDAKERQIARVRTLTVLRTLDARRNAIVLRFLQEAGLREKEHPIVKLSNIGLGDVALQGADLSGLNLNGLSLSEANLSKANLSGADLRGVTLSGANLSGASFYNTTYVPRALGGTIILPNHADLNGANLNGANLSGAKYIDEQIEKASLKGATMRDGDIHP